MTTRTYEGLAVPECPSVQDQHCFASESTGMCEGVECSQCIFFPANLPAFERWQADRGEGGAEGNE